MTDADRHFREFVEPWAFRLNSTLSLKVVPGGGFNDVIEAHEEWSRGYTRDVEKLVDLGFRDHHLGSKKNV